MSEFPYWLEFQWEVTRVLHMRNWMSPFLTVSSYTHAFSAATLPSIWSEYFWWGRPRKIWIYKTQIIFKLSRLFQIDSQKLINNIQHNVMPNPILFTSDNYHFTGNVLEKSVSELVGFLSWISSFPHLH